MRAFRHHAEYYLSLSVILIFGIFITIRFAPDTTLQMATVVLLSLLYVCWGILHHVLNHNINTKIVVEYILISSLGMSIVLFLLKGGLGL